MCDDENRMPVFHVFVDAAADSSTVGKERLANAIAEHYGLPVAELRTRIASGRFRVKGNCDGATADMYVRDLTRLGARCSVEEATPQNKANTPLPFPAVTPGATTTGVPPTPPTTTLPPPVKPGPGPKSAPKSALPPAPSQPPASGNYQSGLSAAFSSSEAPVASLGALEGNGDFAFTLASVDGAEDNAPPPPKPQSFEPPGGASTAAAPAKPAPKPKTAKAAAPKDVPIDMFAPPDSAAEAEFKVDLAPEEVERSARKKASTPPPVADAEPAPSPASSGRQSRPSLQVPTTTAPESTSGGRLPAPLANPNLRFALGVVLAIVIGFIPAHLVASMREKSAYESVDKKVIATQKQADTPDAYAALDTFRDEQLGRKQDDRRTIAIMAILIWGVVGAGAGYVWFRRIPWDRLDAG